MEKEVYKWIDVDGEKYGVLNKHKWDDTYEKLKRGVREEGSLFPSTPHSKVEESDVIVYYDMREGAIVSDKKVPVLNGLFWDFDKREPRKAKRTEAELEQQKQQEEEVKKQVEEKRKKIEDADKNYQAKTEDIK